MGGYFIAFIKRICIGINSLSLERHLIKKINNFIKDFYKFILVGILTVKLGHINSMPTKILYICSYSNFNGF